MRRIVTAVSFVVLLTSCSPWVSQTTTPPTGDLVVFAAASLSEAYTTLGHAFEDSHPGVTVKISFEGSSTLVDQLSQGAPADVLATADRPSMDRAVAQGLVSGAPTLFATNSLTLIVPTGNPARVTGLDASLHGRKLVVCAVGVPCGTATQRLARLLGVTLHPVSEETRVTDVRSKVESGQADAGIVYVTDAKASGGKVQPIAVPGSDQVRNDYLAGTVAGSRTKVLADEFVSLVAGPQGRAILSDQGFATP